MSGILLKKNLFVNLFRYFTNAVVCHADWVAFNQNFAILFITKFNGEDLFITTIV